MNNVSNENVTLEDFLKQYNIVPKNLIHYIFAITHSSYTRQPDESYEKLELLGDAILQFISTHYIYKKYHDVLSAGDLTRLRSKGVCTTTLAEISKEIGLVSLLKTGPGKMGESVINSAKVQADIFESMVAAIYLDQGLKSATEFAIKYIGPVIQRVHGENNKDPKGQLQEYFQSLTKETIHYQTELLPDGVTFYSKAKHNNKTYGEGKGLNKKEAELNAASDALTKLHKN
ncbi:ribonuclease III [Mycoplasma nasistruthionis]|uniref:Ribonuclease 3 n=1 Tax=Mycoplasma nasistruthionis TaxID=353852 RepID=A0A4Y6I5X8_9MOLU|nr:ribonuclease III [Mycoplasma nasistruthionis]QDF65035.1 ribonuclease III [Mycoplasma nasistruthionis]